MSIFLNPPKFWRSYVDDKFVIIKKTEVDGFHNHINNVEASIKLRTREHENNSSIPFLDVCVTRKASGGLMTKIYKKLTHTNRYLNFNSAHSMSQKQGLVKSLLKRAQSQLNSKRANKTSETSKIKKALKKNDYPNWFLKRTVQNLKRKTNSSLANNKKIKTCVVLLYVPRYFEIFSKILRNVGILVCSKPHLTVKDILPKAKDSVETSSRPGVGYQFPCRDCTGIYIEETGRAYRTRLAEHKRGLRPASFAKVDDNNFNKKTALVKHVITKDHRVDWDHSKILNFETDLTRRRFLESFFIHNSKNAINDKENCFYSEIYDNVA